MFVILETGGKQYRVSEGNTINVEKLGADEGNKVILNKVLFVQKDNGEIIVGQPVVENVEVEAEVLGLSLVDVTWLSPVQLAKDAAIPIADTAVKTLNTLFFILILPFTLN